MFDHVLDALPGLLRAQGIEAHVTKIWVYENVCPVVDLAYRGLKFGFNVLPLPLDLFSVDLVQRKTGLSFQATSSGQPKERVADAVSLEEAAEAMQAEVSRIKRALDDALGAAPPAADPDRLPKTEGAQKRVGVLTLPFNNNIGGNLQGYALTETLRQLGHQPILINRRAPRKTARAEDQAADDRLPLIANKIAIAEAPNRAFIEKHLRPISREFQSSEQLGRAIDRYAFDAIVVGSDQVWRPKYGRSLLGDFFLGFLPEDDRRVARISYAASFGAPNWEFDEGQTKLASTLVKRFDAVSVREDSAVDLCRERLGVAATHVVDPTMLLTADHYARLSASKSGREGAGQVLAYVLDETPDKTTLIDSLSSRLGVGAYSTTGLPYGATDQDGGDKSVEGWLAAIRDAAFVVTDSFHGAVFSILFNKPFIAYGNHYRGAARFTSLVKMIGLEDRLIFSTDGLDIDRMLRPIDWAAVNRRLDDLRAQSKQYLIAALTGPSSPDDKAGPSGSPSRAISPTRKGAQRAAGGAPQASAVSGNPLNVLCTGCGACVSESGGSLRMAWNEEGFLIPRAVGGPVPAEAVRVCPWNTRPEPAVQDEDALGEIFLPDATRFDASGGRYIDAYIGYSKAFRPTSSSGGMATFVFEKLLSGGHVDYLYIVQGDGESGYRYQVFDRSADIKTMSKTRYYPVTLEELVGVIEQRGGRVAVSGVACFVKAVRLKQHYHPELKARIPFLVGIICGGLKSRMYTEFLARSAGVEGDYSRPEYRVKDAGSTAIDYSFAATDAQGNVRKVRMAKLGDMWGSGLFKSKACDFCTDVLTELADISLGDAWLPKYRTDGMGNSVVVTRTPLADQIVREGIASGELFMEETSIAQVVQSQRGGANHKHDALKFRVWTSTYFTDLPVPVVRRRLMKSVPLTEALVQIHKERTRAKSLAYWRGTTSVEAFKRRMRASRKGLADALAARQEVRSGVVHPLAEPLAKRPIDALRRGMTGPATSGRIMARWVWSKVKGDQFNLDALRAALTAAEVITPPATTPAKPKRRAKAKS